MWIDYQQLCFVVCFGFGDLFEFVWVGFGGVVVYDQYQIGIFDVGLVVGYGFMVKCWGKICYCWVVLDMCLVVEFQDVEGVYYFVGDVVGFVG